MQIEIYKRIDFADVHVKANKAVFVDDLKKRCNALVIYLLFFGNRRYCLIRRRNGDCRIFNVDFNALNRVTVVHDCKVKRNRYPFYRRGNRYYVFRFGDREFVQSRTEQARYVHTFAERFQCGKICKVRNDRFKFRKRRFDVRNCELRFQPLVVEIQGFVRVLRYEIVQVHVCYQRVQIEIYKRIDFADVYVKANAAVFVDNIEKRCNALVVCLLLFGDSRKRLVRRSKTYRRFFYGNVNALNGIAFFRNRKVDDSRYTFDRSGNGKNVVFFFNM